MDRVANRQAWRDEAVEKPDRVELQPVQMDGRATNVVQQRAIMAAAAWKHGVLRVCPSGAVALAALRTDAASIARSPAFNLRRRASSRAFLRPRSVTTGPPIPYPFIRRYRYRRGSADVAHSG